MKTRKNLTELSSKELDCLINAMKEMKKNGEWDYFVELHKQHKSHIHSSHIHSEYHQFLPWHRIFILKFEEKLRKIDSTIELPYWRWIGTREIPDGFNAKLFGWMNVSRGLTHNGDNLPKSSDVEDAMAQTTFESFSNAIEILHDRVHVWVGGDMANTNTSPKDPLFWFHHAYCDKLCERWRIKKGTMAFSSWNLHHPYESYSIGDIWNGKLLGYKYSDMTY